MVSKASGPSVGCRWLHEPQHEAIARASAFTRGSWGVVPVPRVSGIAQKLRLIREDEAGGGHLVLDDGLLDAMESLGLLRARALAAAVVDDDVFSTRLEVREDRLVHAIPIDAHPDRVVIEEHDQYRVQIACVGRQRVVELAVDAYDVRHDRLRQALAPWLLGESIEDQARVLRVDLPRWADSTGEELARVAAARTQLGDA